MKMLAGCGRRMSTNLRAHAFTSLFEPTLFEATRRPLQEALSLPAHTYTSPEWHAAEVQAIFGRQWMLVGRVDELEQPGSYITLDAPALGPLIALRSKDGELRAFANVCRHRGAKLMSEPQGVLRGGLTCPYHAWTYDTEGNLRGAPKMKENKCFDKAQYPLKPLQLETMAGFVFVAADEQVPPLHETFGNLEQNLLSRFPLEDMMTVGRAECTPLHPPLPCTGLWWRCSRASQRTLAVAQTRSSATGSS